LTYCCPTILKKTLNAVSNGAWRLCRPGSIVANASIVLTRVAIVVAIVVAKPVANQVAGVVVTHVVNNVAVVKASLVMRGFPVLWMRLLHRGKSERQAVSLSHGEHSVKMFRSRLCFI
ncbi:MAG: hypothetical protein K2O58_11215, partial [Bacteroidales bacterium]|nr:hypothetical protein [Bacteroidales bacterium]